MCAICKEYWPEYYEPIPVEEIMDQQSFTPLDIEKAVKFMATDNPIGGPTFKVGDYIRVKPWGRVEEPKFHEYAPEFTLIEERRFTPSAGWGPTEEVVVVHDLKGRRYMVPVEALAKPDKAPKEPKIPVEPPEKTVVYGWNGNAVQRHDNQIPIDGEVWDTNGNFRRWFSTGSQRTAWSWQELQQWLPKDK